MPSHKVRVLPEDICGMTAAEKIAEIERRIKSAKADLAANASNIVPLDDKKAALEEELGALPQLPQLDEKRPYFLKEDP